MAVLPFDSAFQRKLVYLALIDDSFCTQALRYLQPEMFESGGMRWAWQHIQRERREGRTPTLLTIKDSVRFEEVVLQPRYAATADALEREVLREEAYIRHALSEFVQRNLFVAAFKDSQQLYNRGKLGEAIDLMKRQAEHSQQIGFDRPDRGWFFEELEERQRQRKHRALHEWEHTYPTGIAIIDNVMDGGLSRGEFGAWMADTKGGKSLLLMHLTGFAIRAIMCRVLLVLLEGSRDQTQDRLETWFARQLYREVKRGEMSTETYQMLQAEYRSFAGLLVVRGMTAKWNYTAADIRIELDELRSQYGWVPDLIVCDYGDLLRSQDKGARNEEQHQRDAFGDLKVITTQDRGYGLWSASQSRRLGTAGKDGKQQGTYRYGKRVLTANDLADSYNKARRIDFLGSINQDEEDKQNSEARLWADRYRDNKASKLARIKQDLDRMIFVDVLHPLNRPDMPKEKAVGEAEPEQQSELV